MPFVLRAYSRFYTKRPLLLVLSEPYGVLGSKSWAHARQALDSLNYSLEPRGVFLKVKREGVMIEGRFWSQTSES